MNGSRDRRRPRMNQKEAEFADSWNRNVPVGHPVTYRKGDKSEVHTKTRSEASVLSGHTAVVWLEDVSGCVALSHVTPS